MDMNKKYQCIPFARERFKELKKKSVPTSGSYAQDWWDNAEEGCTSSTIFAPSIAVWTRRDGTNGHVGVVESCDDGIVYSDSNYYGDEKPKTWDKIPGFTDKYIFKGYIGYPEDMN